MKRGELLTLRKVKYFLIHISKKYYLTNRKLMRYTIKLMFMLLQIRNIFEIKQESKKVDNRSEYCIFYAAI